ncbi:Rv3654c family TadE-like protein [Streptomyces acidiscabies]|uniref:Membrane protein n=1 Tax=Streptomyces acidiscabies TaxID=42234 RepID=A0A0L0K8E5_9ACTN|nr:membrane protein [Streptomyces acidiscabies]
MKGGSRDRGSASVWGVVVVAVLCVVFGAVLALGQAVVVRHRAAGGADLAALAGAGRALEGAEVACERARGVARAQGGRVVRCSVAGGVVDLTVVVGAGPFEAEGRARAGVVEEGGE